MRTTHHSVFTAEKASSVREIDYTIELSSRDLNHNSFQMEFNALINEYRVILEPFQTFMLWSMVGNLILWGINIWALIWRIKEICEIDAWLWVIHYVTEMLWFELMWLLLLWKIWRNQSLMRKYRDDISAKVVMAEIETSHEKQLIIDYLDTIIHQRSPFMIYGFTATTAKMVSLFSAVIIPMTIAIFNYLNQYS